MFTWISGINVKPNQTLDSVMDIIINVLHRYSLLYLWQCLHVGFLPLVSSWTKPHKSACGQSFLQYSRRAAAGASCRSDRQDWPGARPGTTPPPNHTNWFHRPTSRPLSVHWETCWITLEWLLKNRMFRRSLSHAPFLSCGRPRCADCALNTAVMDGRAHCCLPWFTSWSRLWFPIALTLPCVVDN